MTDPETRYARNGETHIAYQVVGNGQIDLVLVDSWIHHVEMVWDIPEYARLLRRLGSFTRLIHFDRRGTGLSDSVPIEALPDLETQVGDILAVLDAADSGRTAVFGVQDGGLIAMLLAASHPERCSSLILYSGSVRGHGWNDEAIDQMVAMISEDLARGGGGSVPMMAPSRVDDQGFVSQYARLERSFIRPGAVGHFFRQSMVSDISAVIPAISAPTLLLHRSDDEVVPVNMAKELAQLIDGASIVELPGADHLMFAGDTDELLNEIEEFLTGARGGGDPDRVLGSILFTDIVNSTAIASQAGDRRWRSLLDRHDELVRRELARFRGREVATTGDGFLATFDGPGAAVRCALSIAESVTLLGLEIRSGVHTGEIEIRGEDIAGLAVHVAARVAALARGGEVLVSGIVKDLLVGSGFSFEDRGEHELKGVPNLWRIYSAGQRPG